MGPKPTGTTVVLSTAPFTLSFVPRRAARHHMGIKGRKFNFGVVFSSENSHFVASFSRLLQAASYNRAFPSRRTHLFKFSQDWIVRLYVQAYFLVYILTPSQHSTQFSTIVRNTLKMGQQILHFATCSGERLNAAEHQRKVCKTGSMGQMN